MHWHEEIHHISPQTVKDAPAFADERAKVQEIIDKADILIGCAIQNDEDALKKGGISGLEKKIRVEIQDWHWLLRGVPEGRSLYKAGSLLSIAEDVGVPFSESEAHGATADTLATIRCFLALKKEYEAKYGLSDSLPMDELLEHFNLTFNEARIEFLRGEAAGCVQLLDHGGCFSFKFNQKVEKPNAKTIEMIAVNDRFIAEMELKKLFARRSIRENPEFYRLKPADIKKFLEYKNEFDEERSAFCKRFTSNRLNRSGLQVLFK